MGHQSYVLLCTETILSNPPVIQPKSSCDVHLLRSPWTISALILSWIKVQVIISKSSWEQPVCYCLDYLVFYIFMSQKKNSVASELKSCITLKWELRLIYNNFACNSSASLFLCGISPNFIGFVFPQPDTKHFVPTSISATHVLLSTFISILSWIYPNFIKITSG